MTPDQLAAKESESGHQKALFAWAAIAILHGFSAAKFPASYQAPGWQWQSQPVPELRWLHAIPNGGARDIRTAARLKAEGLKAGVADISLPVARGGYHGLYIEMKRGTSGRLSKEQQEFAQFCAQQQYFWAVCTNWREAAEVLEKYLTGCLVWS